MYTEEECQYCRWARDEMGWNYCPECGLPTDPLKAFKNVFPPSEASEQKCSTCGKGKNEKDSELCSNSFHLPPQKYINVTQSEKGDSDWQDVISLLRERRDFTLERLKDNTEAYGLVSLLANDTISMLLVKAELSLLERSRAIDECIKIERSATFESPIAQEIQKMTISEMESLKSRQ